MTGVTVSDCDLSIYDLRDCDLPIYDLRDCE